MGEKYVFTIEQLTIEHFAIEQHAIEQLRRWRKFFHALSIPAQQCAQRSDDPAVARFFLSARSACGAVLAPQPCRTRTHSLLQLPCAIGSQAFMGRSAFVAVFIVAGFARFQ